MTRSKKTGKSSQNCGKLLHIGNTKRKNGTGLSAWTENAYISARDNQEFAFKSPNYFEGLQNEDPDFYRAVMESLKMSTSNQNEGNDEDPDLRKAILESLKSESMRAELREVGRASTEVSINDELDGSGVGEGILSSSVQLASDDNFEVWEDDVYERAMSEDDWETIDHERQHNERPLYSAVLRGYHTNGPG